LNSGILPVTALFGSNSGSFSAAGEKAVESAEKDWPLMNANERR
jgi:hypothetical protein